jgi:hypothetical protein
MPVLSQANCRAGASPAKTGNRRDCPTICCRVERSRDIPLRDRVAIPRGVLDFARNDNNYFFTASAFGALCCA